MEDIKDFDDLFRCYYSVLFIYAKRFLSDDDECYDLVSDVFEEIWKHYADIPKSIALQYMYTCLRRKCLDHLRKQKVQRRYIELSSVVTMNYTTEDKIAELHERERYVDEVIHALPEKTQEIFVKCYVDKMKYQEVADALDISKSTVKKHIVKALRLFKEKREEMRGIS